MRVISILKQRLGSILRRKRAEADLNRELSLHVEQLTKQNIASGMSEPEARLEARREFGGIASIEEACRDTRRVNWIEDRGRDLQYAFRQLRREKAFAAFAILTLALGIGAVTTIFSIVDTVLLEPLAYKEPGRLYAASESLPKLSREYPRLPVNAAHSRSWQEQCRSCESIALLNPASFNLTGRGEPEVVEGAKCTWPLFSLLGVEPQLGRTFQDSDDQPGANRFVVISDSLWRRWFTADPAVIGKSVQIDGEPNIVIGVLRPDFRFPSGEKLGPLNQFPKRAEIFKPMGFDWPKLGRLGQFNFECLVRLRSGENPARAEAEITAAIADAGRQMETPLNAHLTPLQEQVTGRSRRALTLLFAAVGAVLLIVCVNLGNLMLVRASERARDAAIRRALGANAGQLFRPVLTQSLLIALCGGALGLLLAYAGVQILKKTSPIDIPRLDEVGVSLTVQFFALCVSAFCGVACGLWPAIRATRIEPAAALRSGSRSATQSSAGVRQREWLVGVEVALSTVLLVMSALLGLSFLRVTHVERGYVVDRILAADLALPHSRNRTDQQRAGFHQRALEALEEVPGVQSAGLISSLPLKPQVWGDAISQKGDARPRAERPMAQYRFVSEDYFRTMGIALLQGRLPSPRDRTSKVAVISESASRKVWRGENAIGKWIWNEPKPGWAEIIGVVADVRAESLEKQPPIIVYVPYWDGAYWQGYVWGGMTYVVRTAQDPSAMANTLRSAIHTLDPELPLANVLTMREILSESVSSRRFQTLLTALFAAAALLLACLGIYGVISYSVARRTNEIGLRIALGAGPSQVSRTVFRQGIRPVIGGLLVGVAGALALGTLIRSFLFDTEARDPAAILMVIAILLAVAALASWGPARRASRIDPALALRNE